MLTEQIVTVGSNWNNWQQLAHCWHERRLSSQWTL